MDRAKVFLIGGTSGAGKSILAHEMARQLNIQWISMDDLFRAAKGVTTRESHPGLHVVGTDDYVKYYTDTSPERLIADASEEHDATWPAIEPVIRAHSKWGDPIVMEGWALRPDRVAELRLPNVSSFWLVVDPSVLEEREKKNVDFTRHSPDPERMLRNFLARSYWCNDLIEEQARSADLPILVQDGNRPVDALCKLALRLDREQRRAGEPTGGR